MAAKRTLYKPATLQDVGSQESRRTLSQGRLMSNAVLPDTMTVFASPRGFNQNASYADTDDLTATLTNTGNLLEGAFTPPRQSLAGLTASSRILAASNNLNKPRLSPPDALSGSSLLKSPLSPSKPTPLTLLELSDTENELHSSMLRSSKHCAQKLTPSPVLYVDASGGHLDPNRSEVETSTDLVVSPAKVVCHAPAVVESDLRNTGYTQETARVKVDAVPTISLLGDLDVTRVKGGQKSSPPSGGFKGGARTPLVVKESSLAGVSHEKSDVTGLDESNQSEGTNLSASTKPAVKEKKKKVKAKIVPSRYMQAAVKPKAHSASSSMGETTSVAPRNTSSNLPPKASHSKRTVQPKVQAKAKRPASASVSSQPRTRPPTLSQRPKAASHSHYSYTPVARATHSAGVAASTPAVDSTGAPKPGQWDASAIGLSMIQGPDVSVAMAPASGVAMSLAGKLDSTRHLSHHEDLTAPVDTSVFQPATSHSAGHKVTLPTEHKKRSPSEITQETLDLAYARYVQALYLDSKLEKTMKEQEKEAMSQIYGVWHENEKLRTKKQERELELARLRHANQLDQQLELQISGLGPVVAHLDQFKKQYSTLAHALDTTRHQLATVGIHNPQDEDEYHESLLSALAKSEKLLGEISVATQADQPKVTSFANAIHTLQKAVDEEDKELKRCRELLSATCTLATQESSLRIQHLEQ